MVNKDSMQQTANTAPTASPNATISPSDDDMTLEAELNATDEGDIEKDLKEIDASMNSL